MVLVTKDQWDIVQKITEEQKEAMAKVVRDLNRYERKRKITARMISAQKKELCNMAADLDRLKHEKEVLIERINDLAECLTDEQETVYEQNDEIERLKGRVEGVGWAFEKVINNK